VFAEVYLMRPIGGLLLGPISDRIGRRSLLQLSVSMLILRSISMAILPTTAQWGGATAPGLIQSVSQAALPGLRAWAEVGGIAPSQCSKAFLPQPISI
jgi:MFS family permease